MTGLPRFLSWSSWATAAATVIVCNLACNSGVVQAYSNGAVPSVRPHFGVNSVSRHAPLMTTSTIRSPRPASLSKLSMSKENTGIDALYNPGQSRSSNESSGSGQATVSQEVFNLVKGIVGAGVLTLPGMYVEGVDWLADESQGSGSLEDLCCC
jgi:hypothetical protein